MYHIIICDDDQIFIDLMKDTIMTSGLDRDEVLFYEYLSGEELLGQLERQQQCDLLILDMQMRTLDGHQTAAQFRNKFPKSTLVFCSGVRKPTDESFKFAPFRYLLKNYSHEKMLTEMKAVVRELQYKQSQPLITGKYFYNIVRLKADDILYIENSRYGSIIHVYEESIANSFQGNIITDQKLKELFEVLHSYGFEFAHNSYIVNLKYIIKMQSGGEIQLIDGTLLHVARSKLKGFRVALSEWLSKKY